ncbi:protein SENSITIVITY TO RED LIGHT REDUCED 1 isoform X1 [Humulus lupulus]|uniref:protein SENSITIVITY TO RED LIGHT REDUCED 1 isoform X1 n=1 Tax=Humulus lupulus TaxID=3486 RepID=UPI002B415D07|nr:protein SENSITIVITY TO RED LIGHT REDUCED 1 isoform X1 [Humulus lupulus]XP_062095577.1 protein SENSITIVITY TO RED LIGHT REDUCED 1 isoform X1 [Humulus lupulus]XP_062095578.1 protein SENSITIVITY TO RED LIGHT REDUCED 1 isoform X1 [Humulus lupulus]XP_062095579.1 protein SENSITIVITY TO RED LIGHT REDUCED 1 isoform X1 [Humulus lupulus]XP_062095580.1 protein SENSITIVITY TO RED LIGHT REDUCED 1 isoform X1 [Humulus lupulus]XP_062095581.1 protein SENSITIVITY TO RED LIGHT REDUCED 1 isoform X1 [Humulus lu
MAASAKTLTARNDSLNEDWTIVVPRRGRRRGRTNPLIQTREPLPQQQAIPWTPTDFEVDSLRESKLIQKMELCMKKLETSQFFLTLLDQIQSQEILHNLQKVLGFDSNMQMVIYGIGSIESYENPRLQLSLALLLKRKFSWIGGIEVFDPVLSTTESQVLEVLGCLVLSIDEQGRRKALKPTIFFMPHCEAELYDNLLEENWRVGLLKNIVLLGNSFENYEQYASQFKNSVVALARHIFSISKFTDEFKIKTVSDDYYGAFHDSSWHFFSPVVDPGSQSSNFDCIPEI